MTVTAGPTFPPPRLHPDTVYVFGQSSNRDVTAADNVYGDNVVTTAVLVPEPSTYAMLVLGVGLLGWVTRAARGRVLVLTGIFAMR